MTSVKKNTKAQQGILILEQYENRNLKFKKSEINFNKKLMSEAPSECRIQNNSQSVYAARENQTMVNFKSPFKTNQTLENLTSLRKKNTKPAFRGEIVGGLNIDWIEKTKYLESPPSLSKNIM